MTTADVLRDLFAQGDVDGFVHAIAHDGRETGTGADTPVHPASMAKVCVLAAIAAKVDRGELSFSSPLRIPAGDRTPGATGLSLMADEAVLSVRDVAISMVSVSDNHATDVLFEAVTPAEVTTAMTRLGLVHTRVRCSARDALATLANGDSLAMDPARSAWSSTARELARLLHLIWTDQAASAASCAEIRHILATQVISRFAPAYADLDVAIASKTGTAGNFRGETGVITHPDGSWTAVTVALRTSTAEYFQPAADSAIGAAARLCTDSLQVAR